MRRIEQGLTEVHSQFIAQGQSSRSATSAHANGFANGVASNGEQAIAVSENAPGFATVAFVHNGSPADLAVSIVILFSNKIVKGHTKRDLTGMETFLVILSLLSFYLVLVHRIF